MLGLAGERAVAAVVDHERGGGRIGLGHQQQHRGERHGGQHPDEKETRQ